MSRRVADPYRLVVVLALLVLAVVGFRNAALISPEFGYDAAHHQQYASQLVRQRSIPTSEDGSAYYKPPGFYLVAGVAELAGEAVGLDDPRRAVLYLNVALLLAAALVMLMLARLLWPGRPVLQLGAFVFFCFVPVVPKAATMYYPGTLALLLATLSLYVTARVVAAPRVSAVRAAGLGLLLVCGILVMTSSLWVYAAVVAAFAILAAAEPSRRRALLGSGTIVLLVAFVLASPWFVRQTVRHGNPFFGGTPVISAPWQQRGIDFVASAGVPEVMTRPVREAYKGVLVPTAYSELWGDYFGVFAWYPIGPSKEPPVDRLALQSWVGLLPTGLALAGWLALAARLRRTGRLTEQPGRVLVVTLPAFGLLGFLYYASVAVTPDGDTIKATYLLSTAPGWALAFGFALDALRSKRLGFVFLCACLAAALIADLAFLARPWAE